MLSRTVRPLALLVAWGLLITLLAAACAGRAQPTPKAEAIQPSLIVSTPLPASTPAPLLVDSPARPTQPATPLSLLGQVSSATPTQMPTATPAAKPQETSPQARDDPAGYALRFFGTGSDDVDRVKIALDAPSVPADVGAEDFTLEWWMKASLEENRGSECTTGNDNWITGNIIFDRDIWGGGDYGDYGVSLAGGHVAFGVNNGTWGEGICSTTQVADGQWRHIAVTRRRSDGLLTIFVDGRLDAQAIGPEGDVSYRDGRDTGFEDDPYLVIGAEKHDAGPEYPSYNGWLDEVRLSNTIRYGEDFTPPSAPFLADGNTVALWHFDEGSGEVITDASPQGRSVGVAKIGGPQAGPRWVISDAPLGESR